MTTKRSSKPLTILLVVISASIWGIIAFRVYESLEPGSSLSPTAVTTRPFESAQLPSISIHEFEARLSALENPFRPFAPKPKKPAQIRQARKTVAPPFSPPPMRYSGFLQGADGLLAILSLNNSAPLFCGVGDTAFSARILEIRPQLVVAETRGNRFEIQLQP